MPVTGKFFYVCFISLLLSAPPALADIYVFVDQRGVRHFTNVPAHEGYRLFAHSPRPAGGTASENAYDQYIREAARRYGLDPMLIKAVIKKESGFNRYARSSKGAMGLMQLMPETARDMRVADALDPRENIFGGARYLKKLHTMFNGDLKLVLASYNAGPDRVKRGRAVPDIAETRHYVRAVMRYYRSYKNNI